MPTKGPRTYSFATVTGRPATTKGKVLTYDVRIEKGLPFDANVTAAFVQGVLNDPRSWTGSGRWRFQQVKKSRKADFHLTVSTPRTTDALCAPLRTRGEVSCQNGRSVVLNAERWAKGSKSYQGKLARYRKYLVNHEFGHALGFDHVGCAKRGRPAPAMLQQTKGLQGCKTNPWPSPKR